MSDLSRLTRAERRVYERTVTGATAKQIARSLGVSPRTVEFHRHNIAHKFGAHSITEVLGREIIQLRSALNGGAR